MRMSSGRWFDCRNPWICDGVGADRSSSFTLTVRDGVPDTTASAKIFVSMGLGAAGEDDPERALRDVRGRFIAAFPGRCDSMAALLADAAADRARAAGARQIAHRLTGLAGTVGFPTVSARAAELEALLSSLSIDAALASDLLDSIRDAFATDLMRPPEWAETTFVGDTSRAVLVVEDDPEQLALLEIQLQRAGHRTVSVARGDEVVEAVRARNPSVVMLDVDLPGLDGFRVCRALKTDVDLAGIPVLFLTTHATIDSRLSGLALGADDYLCKPVDARELLLRVSRLARETVPAAPAQATLAFDAFTAVGDAVLASAPASLALLRTAPDRRARLADVLAEESRPRDVVGHYDDAHLVWLLPGVPARGAIEKIQLVIQRAAEADVSATAGVAAGTGGSRVAALFAQADEALTEARYRHEPAALWTEHAREPQPVVSRTLVLADDDPEVVRVVDGYMRSMGFQTVVVFDGAKALEAIEEREPDVVILDLMMPAMNGFDVLKRLQGRPRRPRIVVLSARGREDDVTRAFDLGADDYIVKPFSPQEVRARIMKLLK